MKRRHVMLVIAALLVPAGFVLSATFDWTGESTAGNDWDLCDNWSGQGWACNCYPACGNDDVYVDIDGWVRLEANQVQVDDLYLRSSFSIVGLGDPPHVQRLRADTLSLVGGENGVTIIIDNEAIVDSVAPGS